MLDMERKKIGAGIIAIDKKTGDILLGKRSFNSNSPNTWAPFGGTFEIKDENPKNTAKREFEEETGIHSEYELSSSPFYVQEIPNLIFYSYLGIFNDKVNVTIDSSEHSNSGWFPLNSLPSNLHPGFEKLLSDKKSELENIIENLKEQN